MTQISPHVREYLEKQINSHNPTINVQTLRLINTELRLCLQINEETTDDNEAPPLMIRYNCLDKEINNIILANQPLTVRTIEDIINRRIEIDNNNRYTNLIFIYINKKFFLLSLLKKVVQTTMT